MTSGLPTGTVTFLFTDIEGSTRLLEELGDGYAGLLEEHRETVRRAIAEHDGVEVDTQGDAFFVAFGSARDAVNAAADVQGTLAPSAARVRIGLHTGEATVGPDGYVGIDVHRAARICAAAHGGQILVSQSTRDLVDWPTRDLGEHRLKDLTAPQRLHQLIVDGLPDAFPPPRTLDVAATNLPVEPMPLVGRERELRDAMSLLEREEIRLLTLTGPGGVGKTRLALQLAAELVGEYEDGVFLVDLASIRDPELVVPTIGRTVGLSEAGGRPVAEALAEFLGDKRTLLVIDNVEHVVDSAPALGRLLASCRRLEVVATSREPLRVAAEQEYPVPPLSAAESVELFTDRARAVRPGFEVDGDLAAIVEICARLDGLPLAIELAASRVKVLPPPKLLERLDQRLSLLTGGARDAPERQQTLRAAIDWSFDLLDPPEQALFTRLSVFAGGCTLEAAETVCAATIDGLASLVDKSLLAEREGSGGEPRFVMLETVRAYARERLEQGDELDEVRCRHAEYQLALAEEGRTFHGDRPSREEQSDRLYDELANIRCALEWFAAAGEVESELRLASAAMQALWTRGVGSELQRWVTSALARADDVDGAILAEGLGQAAFGAHMLGDLADGRRYATESLTLARTLGDKARIEWALRVLSFGEEDLEVKQRLLRECKSLLQELQNDDGLAWVMFLECDIFLATGQPASAREQYRQVASLFEHRGKRWEAANAEIMVAYALVLEHREHEAASVVEDALRTMSELDARSSIAECLEVLAAARVEGDAPLATRLLGAAAGIREQNREPGEVVLRRLVQRTEASAREYLDDRFEPERQAGRALTMDEAVALVLGES
jgi:predicted ATPase/class 3 adenylate cyclase